MIPYHQYETPGGGGGGGVGSGGYHPQLQPPVPPHHLPHHPHHHPHHPHHHHHHGYPPRNTPPQQSEVPKYARLLFKLPRVVPNQKEKFESEELFKKHVREGEVRYTLYRDRPLHERQAKFQAGCRDGHTEISFSGTGLVVLLNWSSLVPPPDPKISSSYCDFNKERGKVHIVSSFILNGVCVRWRGWLDLERLDGTGCLELDEELLRREEAVLQKHIQLVHQKLRDCEERYRTDTTDMQIKKLPGYA